MTPYFLLTRDPHQYQQLARELNQYSSINTHRQDRAPVNANPLTIAQLISEATYHVINGVEHRWNRASALLRK